MKWLLLLLLIYTIFFAPGKGGLEDPVLNAYLSGKMDSQDPLVTMVFSFLGIFPILWTGLYLRQDDSAVPAWPFALLSFGAGAFSLIPYLFFKGKGKRNRPFIKKAGRLLSARFIAYPLIALTAALYLYGLLFGSLEAYVSAFYESKLVSVMTADFIVLVIYSFWWIRRESPGREFLCLVPLAGALAAASTSRAQKPKENPSS
ncbi:hypothetical protein GKZ89_06645 [Bacillus mangrovi]|uniref:DUF2834 domain-containing protein n=1 Tax=Metabacillus mangrovi TaxID=1491830 RepID=A0A7X2V4F9_9BACI|nr:hypothetical protein [Metabacillus mangrovi]MTH53086.1 hypothetical protein [Metabacillus mangrovi]